MVCGELIEKGGSLMSKRRHSFIYMALSIFLILNLMGCTIILQKGRRSDLERIDELSGQLDQLRQTKRLLEQRLKQEIADKQVSLKMAEKGLVITFLAEVLFDSGKAKVRPEAFSALDKVARVLTENIPDMEIGIEGHTDTQRIRFSGWKSNWELSSARAMGVLHYLVDKRGIDPARVSAIGYGQYRPVASNDTAESRQLNRRVEIVILPRVAKFKVSEEKDKIAEEIEENLK